MPRRTATYWNCQSLEPFHFALPSCSANVAHSPPSTTFLTSSKELLTSRLTSLTPFIPLIHNTSDELTSFFTPRTTGHPGSAIQHPTELRPLRAVTALVTGRTLISPNVYGPCYGCYGSPYPKGPWALPRELCPPPGVNHQQSPINHCFIFVALFSPVALV